MFQWYHLFAKFRFIEAKLHIFGDMLAYLSRLVPAAHLEDYSYLCSRRSDARLLLLTPGAPLLPCGDAPLLFLSPEGLFHEKSLEPQKIRGQQGDKREKVKKLKYLFTISYRLILFPASPNNTNNAVISTFFLLCFCTTILCDFLDHI